MAPGPPTGHPGAADTQLCFYPAYCYKASSTYFTWVKLTAADIHYALRSRPGFTNHSDNISYQRQTSPNLTSLYFYLNHPIQFVCVVGVVIALDEQDCFWAFTVDDSSGTTIDVTCRKPEKPKEQDGQDKQGEHELAQQNGNASVAQAATPEACSIAALAEAHARAQVISRVDIGSVVKVKGTIGVFRSVRQVALERLEIVPDTNAEVRCWNQRTQLVADVLSKPWKLSAQEQKRLLKEAEGEVVDSKTRAARRAERLAKEQRKEKRHARKIALAYEAEERERERLAAEMRQHGLDLHREKEKREQEGVVTMPAGEQRSQRGKTALSGQVAVCETWCDPIDGTGADQTHRRQRMDKEITHDDRAEPLPFLAFEDLD